jgi:hypothetical protein
MRKNVVSTALAMLVKAVKADGEIYRIGGF